MELVAVFITNNGIQQYGRVARLTCHPSVLFVFIPDPNGMRYKKIVGSVKTDYYPTTVFPKENV